MNGESLVLRAIGRYAAESRVALQSGGETLTYRQLYDKAQALAALLRGKKTNRLGILLDNGMEWCIADIACIMAGIVTVPLPPFFTESQRQHALQVTGADTLLTWQAGEWGFLALENEAAFLPEHTAKVTFTSGTTGQPKGVCLSQAGMEQVAESLLAVIGAEKAKRHLALLPLAVLLENVAGFYATLLAGGCYVVEPFAALGYRGMQPDGAVIMQHLATQRITSCILVPELLRSLVTSMERQPVALPDLCFAAVGGAKVSPLLLQRAQALGLPVYEGYGLSESASVVAVNTPEHGKAGSVGRILPHIRCHIAARELVLEQPALLGYAGEDVHRGNYATGDIVRLDAEGYLFIEGRKRNVLITSHGRNISPEWPESELLAQPEIAQALVIGEAQPFLAALLVPAHAEADLAAAVAAANTRLPVYAQIAEWHMVAPFTPQNGLLTANGRIRRAEAVAHYDALIESIYAFQGENHGVL